MAEHPQRRYYRQAVNMSKDQGRHAAKNRYAKGATTC
jgi:hypothetical protein